jgi:hypothetical protein
VEAFSGKTGRATGTTNHPSGRAVDVSLYDAAGRKIDNYIGNPFGAKNASDLQAFKTYEQFAQVARQTQQQMYPNLADAFRWGGYFQGGVNPGDLMHFDISGERIGPQTDRWTNGLQVGSLAGVSQGAKALSGVQVASASTAPAMTLNAPAYGGQTLQGYADVPGRAPAAAAASQLASNQPIAPTPIVQATAQPSTPLAVPPGMYGAERIVTAAMTGNPDTLKAAVDAVVKDAMKASAMEELKAGNTPLPNADKIAANLGGYFGTVDKQGVWRDGVLQAKGPDVSREVARIFGGDPKMMAAVPEAAQPFIRTALEHVPSATPAPVALAQDIAQYRPAPGAQPARSPESWAQGASQYRSAAPSASVWNSVTSTPTGTALGVSSGGAMGVPASPAASSDYTQSISQYRSASPAAPSRNFAEGMSAYRPATPAPQPQRNYADSVSEYRPASPAPKADTSRYTAGIADYRPATISQTGVQAPAAPRGDTLPPNAFAVLTGQGPLTADKFLAGQGMMIQTPNARPQPAMPSITARPPPRAPAPPVARPQPRQQQQAPVAHPAAAGPNMPTWLSSPSVQAAQQMGHTINYVGSGSAAVQQAMTGDPGTTATANNLPNGYSNASTTSIGNGYSVSSYTTPSGNTITYQNNPDGSSSPMGGDTVLCTYFHRKGWLPRDLWEADTAFAKTLPRRVRRAYLCWALPAVRRLQAGDKPLEFLLWHLVVKPWATFAGYRMGIRKFALSGFVVHHVVSRAQGAFSRGVSLRSLACRLGIHAVGR